MDKMDSPADLRGDAEVLADAEQILRKRFTGTGQYGHAIDLLIGAQLTLAERARHPQRQHLRGGTAYTPPPAPEGTVTGGTTGLGWTGDEQP